MIPSEPKRNRDGENEEGKYQAPENAFPGTSRVARVIFSPPSLVKIRTRRILILRLSVLRTSHVVLLTSIVLLTFFLAQQPFVQFRIVVGLGHTSWPAWG